MPNMAVSGLGFGASAVSYDAFRGAPGGLTGAIIIDGHEVTVRLAGELDLESAPALDQELAALDGTQFTRLVIDLRGLTFMDSSGLRSIGRAHKLAESNGHTLVLRRGRGQVRRLFELTGVADRLTFEDE